MVEQNFKLQHNVFRNQAGEIFIDESFYLNQQFSTDSQLLHCFGYGDCSWRRGKPIERSPISAYHSFAFVYEGDWILWHENRKIIARPGDMVVERFRESTKWTAGPSGYLRKRTLLLSYTPLQNFLCNSIFSHGLNIFHLNNPQKIDGIMLEIRNLIINGSPNQQDDIALLLFRFLQELHCQFNQAGYPDMLVRSLNFINSNKCISLNLLAEHCNTSISTLSRLFRKHLGCSPGQYLIKHRLERACNLLQVHNLSIKAIAAECGYGSPMFFAREFKQHYGTSPSRYRRDN